MMPERSKALFRNFGVSAYDIATRDKLPVLAELMSPGEQGLALDIGSGTGYTTYGVFGDRPTVCLDLHAPNLQYHRTLMASVPGAHPPLSVVARATALPFKAGVFSYILCSEVLEHIEEDDKAATELARVLACTGKAVISVPYTGNGFTSFLELCGIKSVHDFPGPERHVRPGYDECSMGKLLSAAGLEIERRAFYFRFFTRLTADLISLAHRGYQRLIHRRLAWTWSEAAAVEGTLAFRLYRWFYPVVWACSRIDALWGLKRGFGLIISVRRQHRER